MYSVSWALQETKGLLKEIQSEGYTQKQKPHEEDIDRYLKPLRNDP